MRPFRAHERATARTKFVKRITHSSCMRHRSQSPSCMWRRARERERARCTRFSGNMWNVEVSSFRFRSGSIRSAGRGSGSNIELVFDIVLMMAACMCVVCRGNVVCSPVCVCACTPPPHPNPDSRKLDRWQCTSGMQQSCLCSVLEKWQTSLTLLRRALPGVPIKHDSHDEDLRQRPAGHED